jgi:hypothetical protein
MAITSRGFTGSVDQVEWAKMMTASSGSGLTSAYAGTGFNATLSGSTRQFTVQPGTLWASGVLVEMDTAATTTASSANASGLPRIDLLVMRVNWTTGASALMVLEGTPAGSPQPPTFLKSPGVTVDIPLCEARLNASASAYLAGSAFSRRYWVQDGLYVIPVGTRLPDMPPGRLIVQPGDEGALLVGNVDGQVPMQFKEWRDSGWLTVDVPAPGGFGGSLKGRIINGQVELMFNWTKTGGTGTGSNVTFSSAPLPVGWRPGGIDISRVINAGDNHCRVLISSSTGSMQFGPLTMAAGQILNGGFTYTNQFL